MKRSLFSKYINAALLLGLMAPTAQLFSQNSLRRKTAGYIRSTGLDFGKGIRRGAERVYQGTASGAKWAYEGATTGLKRIGAGLTISKEKAITRAKKEEEHLIEGAKAALKRMRGKTLTKKEQDHLYSLEKRGAGALLVLVAILGGIIWKYKKTPPAPVSPSPISKTTEGGEAGREVSPEIIAPGESSKEPPAPPLSESKLGEPLSMSTTSGAPLPSEEPPAPPSEEEEEEEEKSDGQSPSGSPEREPSPIPSSDQQLIARQLAARREAMEGSELEPEDLGESFFGPKPAAPPSPATAPTIEELRQKIKDLSIKRKDLPEKSLVERARLTNEIRLLKQKIRGRETQKQIHEKEEQQRQAHRRGAEIPSPISLYLANPPEQNPSQAEGSEAWGTESQSK